MTQDRPLALSFPLHGSQLIEASAGTGKTFTISALYLRLVLGHGGEQAFGRELLPPQILVVTFTDAATKELRERIRARLAEAARFFRGELDAADPLLHQLRDDYPQEAWPRCASRLEIAVQWMDEAAVSTIHGWCQRMLREHAFDSGSLFTQTLETDHSDLLGQVMRDYWRRFCYGMQGEALAWVRGHWGSPDALLPRIRPLFGRVRAQQDEQAPEALIQTALGQRTEQLAALKAPWAQWADELRQICRDAVAAKRADGRKMQARYFEPWFDKLCAWATDEQAVELDLGTGFTRLTPAGMAEAWKSGEPPEHPGLHAMQTLQQQLQALASPDAQLLEHAAGWVSARFEVEKRRRAEMGFDDMLLRLQHALASEAGERLAGLIREQFPVALIDEFQDTDPVQYGIFERIYQISENRPETGLFMIGDPSKRSMPSAVPTSIPTSPPGAPPPGACTAWTPTTVRARPWSRRSTRCFSRPRPEARGEGRFCSVKRKTTRCPSSRSAPKAVASTCWWTASQAQPCNAGTCRAKSRYRAAFTASTWLPAAPAISSPCSTVGSRVRRVSATAKVNCAPACLRISPFSCATATRHR